MAAGFCSTCKRPIRGGFAAHSATKSHRAALHRAERSRSGGSVERTGSGARRGRAAARARRSQDVYLKGHAIKVRTYRRSRPNDGTRKVVHVVRHHRMPPRARGEYVPPWKKGADWW